MIGPFKAESERVVDVPRASGGYFLRYQRHVRIDTLDRLVTLVSVIALSKFSLVLG